MVNKVLEAKLNELMERPNNAYTRGVLHGFLLALTTENRMDNDEALDYLDRFRAREESF